MNNISDRLYNTFEDSGVSPVIGVILMVAVTVALVALVTVLAFDIGGDVSESPDATVELVNDDGTVEATVLRNVNVNEFKIRYEDGTTQSIGDSAGDTGSIEEGSGTYQIIAVMNDGSEQVLKTKEYESVNTGTTVSGTIEVNPKISGANVKALDSNGNVLATTTTDSKGKYSFEKTGIENVKVSVTGFEYDDSGTTKKVYATDILDASSGTVDKNFGTMTPVDKDIDGDGKTEQMFYGTDSDGDYQISTVEQLQGIVVKSGEDYDIVSDIDASSTSSWNSGSGFEPLGESYSSLNGNGHNINGLKVKSNINKETFSNIKNTNIKNADIKVSLNPDHTNNMNVGGFIGKSISTTVEDSSIKSDIKISGADGKNIGGVIGKSIDTTVIDNSSFDGTIKGDDYIGGIIGNGDNSDIEIRDNNLKGTVDSFRTPDNIGKIVGSGSITKNGNEIDNFGCSQCGSDGSPGGAPPGGGGPPGGGNR